MRSGGELYCGPSPSALGGLVVGALVLGTPQLALAQTASASSSETDDTEARALFEAGEQAFAAGNFERALEHFRRSYELSHRPELLYNIGLSADRVRRDSEALEAFEAYLESAPDGAERASVEARVAALRRVTATTAESERGGVDLALPIATLVSGAVLMVGGGVLFGVAASENDLVEGATEGTNWSMLAGHHEAREALAIAGGVTLGVGAILVVTGSILFATTGPANTTVAFGPGSVHVGGSF